MSYKKIGIGNISIDAPLDMQKSAMTLTPNILALVNSYDFYAYETQQATFNIISSEYKRQYLEYANIDNAVSGIISSLQNNGSIRGFKVLSKEPLTVSTASGYVVTCELFYGPNKTLNKFAVLLQDTYLIQIVGLYNASSKASAKIIERMIASISII